MAREAGGDLGGDERLLGRLRQLSLIELDSLLACTSGAQRDELLAAVAADLSDALGQARRRMGELTAEVAAGPDPLAALDAPAARLSGAQAQALTARLIERAAARRDLARLEEAAALLLPRLFEVERHRR
jgi:hypothetical protein